MCHVAVRNKVPAPWEVSYEENIINTTTNNTNEEEEDEEDTSRVRQLPPLRTLKRTRGEGPAPVRCTVYAARSERFRRHNHRPRAHSRRGRGGRDGH